MYYLTHMRMNISTIKQQIEQRLKHCLVHTDLMPHKVTGKVRDCYDLSDRLLLVTTDRLSAFDRHIANIPCKGQVLNQLSAWWFAQTQHIIPNHVINVPDPNVIEVKKYRVFPVEFVVRGYITGTTNTSLWTLYQQGQRQFGEYQLADGLSKNQALAQAIITPTTKAYDHDQPITAKDIIAQGLMTATQWEAASNAALQLFAFGQQRANERGLILVDTKYEFGQDNAGNIVLIDEIHTADSSRYWLKDSYQQRLLQQQEPDNLDKEILRLWYKQHCDPYGDQELPTAPKELIVKVASSYVQLYEMITGEQFEFPSMQQSINDRIKHNLNLQC